MTALVKIPTIPNGLTLITDLPVGDIVGPLLRLEYESPVTGWFRKSATDIYHFGATLETYKETEPLWWGIPVARMRDKDGSEDLKAFYDELSHWVVSLDPKGQS